MILFLGDLLLTKDILILSFAITDATLTHEVQKFVSNKSLLNPDIDTSVTIFGRHSGEQRLSKGFKE